MPATRFRLAGGQYNLSMQNLSFSGEVTITSASTSNAAVFSKINLTRASNLTFEGVDLKAGAGAGKPFVIRESSNITIRDALIDGQTEGGYGDGHGLWIAYSDGFTLENTDVRDFNVAGYFLSSDDLAIRNNSFDNIAMDTLILGRVHGVQIANNVIDMNVKGGTKHTDAIQILEYRHQRSGERRHGQRQYHSHQQQGEPRNLRGQRARPGGRWRQHLLLELRYQE